MKIWLLVSRQSGSTHEILQRTVFVDVGRSRHAAIHNMKSAPVIFY